MTIVEKKSKSKPTTQVKRAKITRCKLTKKQQLRMVEFFVLGVTARTAADLMGIQPKTAALFYRKLRELIAFYLSLDARNIFNGEFVLDETSLVDKQSQKLAIFGMMAREGKVFTKMSGQINPALVTLANPSTIKPDSIIFALKNNVDLTLNVNDCVQERESNQDRSTSIQTEDFWNQAKQILRKYNGIPKSSFPLFLKECEFRFNYGTPKEQLKILKIWTGLK